MSEWDKMDAGELWLEHGELRPKKDAMTTAFGIQARKLDRYRKVLEEIRDYKFEVSGYSQKAIVDKCRARIEYLQNIAREALEEA